MAYKGRYKPKNRSKYKGNTMNVIYRSSWERDFMIYCDTTPNIIKWSSEELKIPYKSPIDNKMHTYYPDFWIKIKKHDGQIQQTVIEIKPKKQTKPPKKLTTNKTKYYLQEVKAWGVNQAKWKAAEVYCKHKQWNFKILTEYELKTK
jgi:hypothetical protein